MKTYEVTIKATIIKTFTIEAESRETAIEQANETFHVGHEFDVPEDYEQDVVRVSLQPPSSSVSSVTSVVNHLKS